MPWPIGLVPRKYLAAQLRRPSGLFGRLVLAPMLNRRNAAINIAVLRALELEGGERVLEVGFGGGDLMSRVLLLVPGGKVTGVDFSRDMVDMAARRFSSAVGSGALELVCAPVEKLPCPDASIDKVCTVNTIYFWSDPVAGASELFRVIAPGGRLVIGFAPRETLERLPVTEHGFAKYEPDDVRALLLDAGFCDVSIEEIEDPDGVDCCAVAVKAS
ncbi:MAG: methyltransferase domain-containing protein [Coriobacteriales bacterium]|nr:methyltransferase domain-containing protein [Coriobacteriales bacterium]